MRRLLYILCSMQLVPGAVNAQVNLQSGLVAYFPFNGNDRDQSGKNNHPVFNNTKLVDDKQGNKKSACYFNGKGSYIRLDNNASLNPEELTLAVLVKPQGFYNGNCYNNALIDKGSEDYQTGNYSLRFTAGEYTQGDCSDGAFEHQNFVGFASRNHGATSKDLYIKLNQWYCVVYTLSKNVGKLYVNGQLISSKKTTDRIGYNDLDVYIGRKGNDQFPYWFNGIMDDIRIYNRPLNEAEVKALCEQQAPGLQPQPCLGDQKPSAKFDYTITDCNTVSFRLLTNNTSNIKTVKWLFGDGKTSAEKKPAHIYSRFGEYKVKAIVTNKQGCSDTITKEIKLAGLNTDFVISEPGEPGVVQFKAKNNKASYSWSFENGNVVKNESFVSHTFNASGTYAVRMFAKNSTGCTDTVIKNIAVKLPEVNAEKDILISLAPSVITATAASLPGVSLEKREKDIIRTIPVKHDSLFISLYDNGIVDGDSITLIYNNNIVVTRQPLSEKPVRIAVKVDKGDSLNELVMYADNMGTISPNTALLVVYDGDERHTITLSSTRKTSGAIAFTKKE